MQSSMVDLLNTPDVCNAIIIGTPARPLTTIIQALRAAEAKLAIDGWAPVLKAGEWIAKHHPDEQPADHGCRSWQQVIHESRLFDLCYRTRSGRREGWFRSKSQKRSLQ